MPYYWWINPVPSKSNSGSPAYQYVPSKACAFQSMCVNADIGLLVRIYDSVNLQYTLHADTEVLNSVGSTNFRYTPVFFLAKMRRCQNPLTKGTNRSLLAGTLNSLARCGHLMTSTDNLCTRSSGMNKRNRKMKVAKRRRDHLMDKVVSLDVIPRCGSYSTLTTSTTGGRGCQWTSSEGRSQWTKW